MRRVRCAGFLLTDLPVLCLWVRVYSWDYIKDKNLKSKGSNMIACDKLLAAVYAGTMEQDKTLNIKQVMGLGGKDAKHLTA